MPNNDLFSVIRRPLLTERSTAMKDAHGQYFFEVGLKATKGDVKRAVQEIFKVKVSSVRTMIVPGKERRMGRTSGYRSDWKKAIVTLQKGQKIDLVEQAS